MTYVSVWKTCSTVAEEAAGMINSAHSKEITTHDNHHMDLVRDITAFDMHINQVTELCKHQKTGVFLCTVLLTGATGFLGGQILRSILDFKFNKRSVLVCTRPLLLDLGGLSSLRQLYNGGRAFTCHVSKSVMEISRRHVLT